MNIKKYYATALGLYSDEDFDGPPPMPYNIVYLASDVDPWLNRVPITDDWPKTPKEETQP
jgi:hypothetical protein